MAQCLVHKTHFPFLFIDETSTKPLPSPDFLAMFTIVLTTNRRFTNEWQKGSFEDELKRESSSSKAASMGGIFDHVYETLAQSEEACNILKVNWLRMIVDEGHSMGRGRDNSAISFASWVEAERRWVMTGTPTRQTNAQSGLSSIRNLMEYLKHDFFSRRQDGTVVWQNLIARGWNQGNLCSFYRLRSLLKLLMVRHTKLDIEELQPPRYVTTRLQMSPEEIKTYNTIVCAVQSNLVITSMEGRTSGIQDSLLYRTNTRNAKEAMLNLRLCCCGGTQVIPTLTSEYWHEFIHDLSLCNPRPNKVEEAEQYLMRATTEQLSPCACCGIMVTMLLVLPCGDLICTECMSPDDNVCIVCEQEFDVDVFQRLQPGFKTDWLHNIEEEAKRKKAKSPQQEETQHEGVIELLDGGAGMLAPVAPPNESQPRRRRNKPGDGHTCVYCPKKRDGKCLLCWKEHDSCNFITKSGMCQVCHAEQEPCPVSETKPTYVINKLLELIEKDKNLKGGSCRIPKNNLSDESICLVGDRRPLKVIVFSQFRKVLNTTGDRLIRRFGAACVAEYWVS